MPSGRSGVIACAKRALTPRRWRRCRRDPFDRMLIAQAQVEGVSLVMADPGARGLSGDGAGVGAVEVGALTYPTCYQVLRS